MLRNPFSTNSGWVIEHSIKNPEELTDLKSNYEWDILGKLYLEEVLQDNRRNIDWKLLNLHENIVVVYRRSNNFSTTCTKLSNSLIQASTLNYKPFLEGQNQK